MPELEGDSTSVGATEGEAKPEGSKIEEISESK